MISQINIQCVVSILEVTFEYSYNYVGFGLVLSYGDHQNDQEVIDRRFHFAVKGCGLLHIDFDASQDS